MVSPGRSCASWMEENRDRLIDISQSLWNFAELGLEEFKSAALLTEFLEEEGFQVERGMSAMPTAFVARYGSGSPRLAIIAEYDALPEVSNKAVPEKSPVPGQANGHGCGHNLFGTGACGAAAAVKYAMDKYNLPGTVEVLGTPAEEVCVGKPYMARDGYFAGIDAAFHFHPKDYNMVHYGSCLAYNSVKFRFTGGEAAHGNAPWHGRSALDAAEIMGVAVQFLREHIDPGQPPFAANTMNYTFTSCGRYPNVIPQEAEAWYVFRITDRAMLEDVYKRILDCARGAAIATGVEVNPHVITGTHEMLQNKALAMIMDKHLRHVGPPEFNQEEQAFAKKIQAGLGQEQVGLVSTLEKPGGGMFAVTDVSEISWFAPTATLLTTCAPKMKGWHNWAVTASAGMSIGHKGMLTAADVLSQTVVDLMQHPHYLEDVRAEFAETMKGRQYKSPLKPGQSPPVPGV